MRLEGCYSNNSGEKLLKFFFLKNVKTTLSGRASVFT